MKKRIAKNGFTLLEVLVAVGLLVGSIIVVSTTWSGNFMRIRKANMYNNVAALLERKMVEIRAQYRLASILEIPDEEAGDFGSEYPLYRWQFKSQKFEMPDLSAVFISKDQGSDELLTLIKQTQEFISQSVKEGTVSVFVKTGPKEVEFSVTTYFVDYNQELTLPGGGAAPAAEPKKDGAQ